MTSPTAAGCYFHRALAFAALNQPVAALRDYEQALRLDPTFTTPTLDALRGIQARPSHHQSTRN
jgi:Tetratricopeptide repeat